MAEARNIIKTTSSVNEKGEIVIPPFNTEKDKFFVT
jgi:hypothetical protein